MKSKTFFYRAGVNCLLAKDPRSDEWYGFIGVDKEHRFFNKRFVKTDAVPLHRHLYINTIVTNSIYKNLTWLGFCEHPFSEEKTLELLKEVADEVGKVEKEDEWDRLFSMVKF